MIKIIIKSNTNRELRKGEYFVIKETLVATNCKYISEATTVKILTEFNPIFFEIKEESGFVKKLLNKVNGN